MDEKQYFNIDGHVFVRTSGCVCSVLSADKEGKVFECSPNAEECTIWELGKKDKQPISYEEAAEVAKAKAFTE